MTRSHTSGTIRPIVTEPSDFHGGGPWYGVQGERQTPAAQVSIWSGACLAGAASEAYPAMSDEGLVRLDSAGRLQVLLH